MDNLIYHHHQVNVNTHSNTKTSSSTSTTSSSMSSSFPVDSNPTIATNEEQSFNIDNLPSSIRFELDQLELELLEGDLTQKGYDKKKAKLLAPYISTFKLTSNDSANLSSTSTSTITINTPKYSSKLIYFYIYSIFI
jgi:hypothetical protein